MKINLIQTVLIAALIIIGSSLHLQEQPRIYDPQKYQQQLQATQDKLKADLLKIQAQFKQLDQSLKRAADDPNQQLSLYSEGIADERDSLYQIQQYLKLPFNQRSCKCFQFSDSMRKNLTDKLAEVEQSLNNVQSKAQNCKDCPLNTQIQKQIKQQKNYLQIMEDTVQAKCCKVYKFLYVDNLNSTNWIYGNFTPQKYQSWIDGKVNNLKTNSTLVRTCPLFTPYVSDNLENCSQCKNQSQFFNLSSRLCETCPKQKIFNYQTHKCDYNITCPSGSKFNEDTVSCQKIQPAFNHSFCPPSAPVWNSELLGCFKCSSQTPYYDQNTGKCTSCPDGFVYNSDINQCVHKDCQPGQIYNENLKICQTPTTRPDQTTNSLCPSDRPFWDKRSLSCSRCPIDHPFFNTTSRNCQVCPQNSTYDASRNLCAVECLQGLQLNPVTLKCENMTPVTQPSDSIISICPPNRPNWNPLSKQCSPCPQDNPFWDSRTNKCQKCQTGQTLNPTTNVCEGSSTTAQCPSGTSYNNQTKQCVKVGGVATNCPQDKPYYNVVTMACTACPQDQPLYNSATNQCYSSGSTPPVTVPDTNPNTNNTQPAQNSTNGQILYQICPPGTVYDKSIQKCRQLANTSSTITQCPPQTVWDQDKKLCKVLGSQTSTTSNCAYNQQWNALTKSCVKCQPNQRYHNQTKKCQTVCPNGQVFNINVMSCSGTISGCPIGLVFNQLKLRCQCSEGLNYKYNTDKNICQVFCKSNQQYNTIQGKCIQIF